MHNLMNINVKFFILKPIILNPTTAKLKINCMYDEYNFNSRLNPEPRTTF